MRQFSDKVAAENWHNPCQGGDCHLCHTDGDTDWQILPDRTRSGDWPGSIDSGHR